ncbi:acyl-CoA thioester hydrolase [Deinobacterium chartae]|uniref:Acyl-CoA thioester hydrolase n=1 Tax=Deinobacterium chartae TaxID=521158 RepID=A0A841HUP9_9DEIO|nr:thioesterase family protein [Deinobacterium chartae]MBB6096646.1 acyl-CoA thioester hydrolase [Deinobacterium chartae]
MKQHITALRVRYAETDQMGVVHHSNYAVWFEMARVEFMEALGLSYREVERRGVYLMLSGLEVKYRRAARFDDRLEVRVWVEDLRSRKARFAYEVTRQGSGEVIATGATEHIATDFEYRLVSMPQDLLDLFH